MASNNIVTVTVDVPVSIVGQIIGIKGINIKDINEKSGATCWVDNSRVVQGCKVMEIKGDLEAVRKAKEMVETQVEKLKMTARDMDEDIPSFTSSKELKGKKGKKMRKKLKKMNKQQFRENYNSNVSEDDHIDDTGNESSSEQEKRRPSSCGLGSSASAEFKSKKERKSKQKKKSNTKPSPENNLDLSEESDSAEGGDNKENNGLGSWLGKNLAGMFDNKEKKDQKSEAEIKEAEERRREEMRYWDLREVDIWSKENLWGEEGKNKYNIGCASTFVCHNTGKVEMLPYMRLTEIATKHFKVFKEELEKEKYDNWKKRGGDDWRQLMMKANKSMENNLCKAAANFLAALHGAINNRDKATARSLGRNVLVTYSYLVPRVKETCRMDVYLKAVESFKLLMDIAGDDTAWLSSNQGRKGVVEIFEEMVEDVWVLLPSLNVTVREMVQLGEQFVVKLDKWTRCREEMKSIGLMRVRQGEAMFKRAAMAMGDKTYTDALYLFQEMYMVVEEARRLLKLPDDLETEAEEGNELGHLWSDLRLLLTDVRVHSSLAEALKSIHDGDLLLDDAIEGYETLQLDLVYNAVDKYRFAVTLARGEDIEIMCMAFTKIAGVYIDVFKDGIHKTKAKEYLNDVMDFSKVLSRNLYTMDWYKEASSFLKNMQDEKQKQEDELWQNQRKVYMEQLSEEVKLLEEHSNDTEREFIVFIFDKFPPKHRAEAEWKHLLPNEGVDDNNTWKKTMMRLVTIYHPDRVDKSVQGHKYHVLCEEITKALTNRYNRFK